jgi:beta-glucanase (GH16 family)
MILRPSVFRRASLLVTFAAISACSELPMEPTFTRAEARVPATPPGTDAFDDDFATLDLTRWQPSWHSLGKGTFLPQNVEVRDGLLRLNTPAGTWDGAEIRTYASYGYGTYSATARCAVPSGAICTLFLYQTGVGDRADEIDIEILPGTREVMFTTWVRGRRTNHARAALPASFDFAAFHTYTITHAEKATEFRIDDVLYARFIKQLPTQRMDLFVSAWWPTWLQGVSTGGAMEIRRITAN